MPKPFSDLTGNGAHMHISLWDVEARDNLFLDKNDTHGLSSLAYAFIGGVVTHAKGLCALTAPSVNSYKRLGARCPNSGADVGAGFYHARRQQSHHDDSRARSRAF
jgi:glutamine synthetase